MYKYNNISKNKFYIYQIISTLVLFLTFLGFYYFFIYVFQTEAKAALMFLVLVILFLIPGLIHGQKISYRINFPDEFIDKPFPKIKSKYGVTHIKLFISSVFVLLSSFFALAFLFIDFSLLWGSIWLSILMVSYMFYWTHFKQVLYLLSFTDSELNSSNTG